MLTAEEVIALLGLEPLPLEGGEFRVTYRATALIPGEALPVRYGSARTMSGAIYYLLREGAFSALHRLKSDEIYHFYLGRPVELLLLHPGGRDELLTLGPDLEAGQRPQVVVPHGVWQGSRLAPTGAGASANQPDFALLGTTMAPAYEPADFELASRDELLMAYPACAELIRALTR